MLNYTINGVTIGDTFIKGKNIKCTVVDFHQIKSLATGEIVNTICIAKSSLGVVFETPFSTVTRFNLNLI